MQKGYFLLLRQIVGPPEADGIPMALYHDRHGIFERSKSEPESLEEQLEGSPVRKSSGLKSERTESNGAHLKKDHHKAEVSPHESK